MSEVFVKIIIKKCNPIKICFFLMQNSDKIIKTATFFYKFSLIYKSETYF